MALIEGQNANRLSWLVPVRRGRMMANPFAFFRGGARVMASDLSTCPHTDLQVHLGGDAHLSNFGTYASPERRLVFDQNDFDETLPGPFEWDVARLAASLAVAAEHRCLGTEVARVTAARAVEAYRLGMARLAGMGWLEVWYDHLDVETIAAMVDDAGLERDLDKAIRKARSRDSVQAVRKLTVETPDGPRIRSQPPVLFPLSEAPDQLAPNLPRDYDASTLIELARKVFDRYRESLPDERRELLERYQPVDVGMKVVGVGSVGTRCLIVLMEGRDDQNPLMLQVKEANSSVLEEFLPRSRFRNHGHRVVFGQKMIQSVSDIFLGWTQDLEGHSYYVRQLRDWKGSFDVEASDAESLGVYASVCGLTLAHGHARSGDPVALSAYMGGSDRFDRSVAEFAVRYERLNASDYEEFLHAIHDGRLEATPGV